MVCLALGVVGLVPDRLRHPRRAPRRAPGRRPGLADGPRVRGRGRRGPGHRRTPPADDGRRLGDLADRAPDRRLDLGPRPGRRRDLRRRAGLDRPGGAGLLHRRLRPGHRDHRHPGRHARDLARTPVGRCSGRCCSRSASAVPRWPSARAGPRSGPRSSRSPCGPPATTCRAILVWYAAAAALALVLALAVDFGTAVNVLSQLHLDGGEATLFLLATGAGAAQRRALLRLLPARARLRGRHPHRGVADRGGDRAAADVPAAGRAARQRSRERLDHRA